MSAAVQTRVIATAQAEVGTREGRVNGHWSNDQKYSKDVPGLEWSNRQPWCATFVSWCALKGGVAALYPRSASCDAGGAWFRTKGQWSDYPAVGAQVFFGTPRDLNHTGLVVAYDLDTITTVEGNAQPLTAKVLTPTGWKLMGDVKTGDEVLDPKGAPSVVTGVYPKGVRPVYAVTLRDGSTTEACDEHLWEYRSCQSKPSVGTTLEVKRRVERGQRINLPRLVPADFQQTTPLLVDPYVLGVLLGDAYIDPDGNARLTCQKDPANVDRLREAGYDVPEILVHGESLPRASEYRVNGVAASLRELGLAGHRSWEKFVPEDYLFASVKDRVALLRGLMDTDGYIDIQGRMTFTSASRQLAEDVQTLVRSLGGRVAINVKRKVRYTSPAQAEPKAARDAYLVQNIRLPQINPFSLERKAARWRERTGGFGSLVVSVEYVRDDEVQCIAVSAPSHLYVTDDFIPTHNTNDSGSREGNGVYLKTRPRRGKNVIGYGYPRFPGGIESADPAWSTGVYVKPGRRPPASIQLPALAKGLLRVDGADISHHQSGVTLAKLHLFRQAGGRFLYHKATQGEGFRDVQYRARRRLARAAGIPFGAYHYANPDVRGSDGTEEARFFLKVATPRPGDLLPVLDLEENEGCTRAELTRFVADFAAEVKRQVGVAPMVYTQYDVDDAAGCPLWVARYSNSNAEPRIPGGWKRWDSRQFSNGDFGRPNSAAGLGHVDLNTLPIGPTASLQRYLIPAKAAAGPPPVVRPPPGKPAPQPAPAPKPISGALRIGTWNLERDRPVVQVLAELVTLTQRTRVEVLMLQETHGYRQLLRQVPGYNPVAFYDILEQSESVILVREGLTVTGGRAVQVTFDPDGKGPRIAGWITTSRGGHTPAKHVTVAVVEGFPFISGHPAPSIETLRLRLGHRQQWRSYREWSERTCRLLANLGERACIGADWNVNARVDKGTQPAFPRAMLARAGMTRRFPTEGTHAGGRIIDGFGVKGGTISGLTVHHLKTGGDHHPVTGLLTY